ncbi:hypothetical protein [Polymorphobacter megasporae]|uniref:hypothetical protein n=1 Tax=Glacieibacterium megasporae TaxID=2835787 RepID=UPI001C1E118A|nr:hypothetical protein [Polymorphobacter megasporae]UAJ10495.1 hypothetical protein KTC28_01650 [Polymorphobacter megasporae]
MAPNRRLSAASIFNFAIVGEGGAACTGPAQGIRIDVEINMRDARRVDDAYRITSKEVFNEQPLAAGDQSGRQVALHVEAEMPAAPVGDIYRLFLSERQQATLDEDELDDLGGPMGGVGVSDLPTDLVPDERNSVDAERLH